jgi:membrane protein DedA with SNARE-associated domain
MFPPLPFRETQTTLALSIFLFTFAYEDGATLLAATLAATGRLDVGLGFASASLGIWAGDMGLYLLGSTVGRRAASSGWLMRIVPAAAVRKAESWFARRGTLTIVMSRFLPGSRFPLYVAAGALRLPASVFSTITGLCSVIWVAIIFAIWHFAPAAHLGSGSMIWWFAAAMLLAPWLLGKTIGRTVGAVRLALRKYQHWEFWPGWLFYPPVVAMCAWLSLKYRGLALPTIANPSFRNGGIVGESKSEILQALMSTAPEFVADGYLLSAGPVSEQMRVLRHLGEEHAISYPLVLKPNVGQRGDGFKLIACESDAQSYLAEMRADCIVQRYVPDEKEIGVFYYRIPGEPQGKIFAVTEKVFPSIVGDGKTTFEAVLQKDVRASLIAQTYVRRFPELQGKILKAGERLRLVEAGNHCQGCIFRDGSHLMSEQLRARIDEISQRIPGFFIGRYDIRYANDADLLRGENFKIIELNGAASEATNIYDERNSLLSAYRTLYQQWDLVYRIGRANRDRGHKPASVFAVLRDARLYAQMAQSYPAAD